ncbi:hypothetical protein SBOR_0957 [Sclerotinia borealis F-4128]|uniref:H/ACA ribonucleoprotein complex non-core subunit NAF1 n=1 Tax=Sclerotinia borealis (strain F-4128) TaxID=1432307 RepID=W9CVT5_SCLBF|nr:hypothetical protein SBOR_0957 [Sclerotinia borealis F-4128]
MNNSDAISLISPEGEHSPPQRGNEESASSSSTFSGIPGLGRLGNAPKSESPKPPVESDAAQTHLHEPTVFQEKMVESTIDHSQVDSTMADAEPLMQESATATINDAISATPTGIKDEILPVVEIESVQTTSQNDSEMRQAPQGEEEEAKINTQDSNSNAMDVEILQATLELHVEQEIEVPAADLFEAQPSSSDMQVPESHASPPELTHALEAMLGGLLQSAAVNADVTTLVSAPEAQATEAEHPEWEVDSSPCESSSDDSSDSSSDDDSEDEDGDNTYKLLSPEEQARILMEGDGGSDDEGASKGAKGAGAQLRTKNEVPEEVIPKPDVTITPEMPIARLGDVEGIVDNIILIKAFTTGEYQVLREESVLCLQDRSVIGVVSETLGRVEQPLYCVRFTNAAAITEAGLSVGTTLYYSEQHSTYVFTQALKAYKGTDASNLYDEEIGDEEMEFSDDEKEAEHKRKVKQRKAEKRGGKTQQNGGGHSHVGYSSQQPYTPSNTGAGLNYDEVEDGPYKPLTRPTGFTGGASGAEAPQEGSHYNRPSHRGEHGGRARGRGRGDRARGDRGRGRGRGGGNNDRNNSQSGGAPSQLNMNTNFVPPHPSPGVFNPQPASLPQKPNFPPPPPASNIYHNPNQPQQYTPQQPQYPSQQPPVWPMYPQGYQQPYQQPQQPFPHAQTNWSAMPPPTIPAGAFINPAFFNQQNGANQNGGNQWTHPGQQNGNGESR